MGSGCWEWNGSRLPKGYGKVFGYGKLLYAHRVSFEHHNGPIPDGKMVLHTCDNPPCINPEHLFLGNHVTNAEDMVSKGRAPRSGARFTRQDIASIFAMRSRGMLQREIAAAVGSNQSYISQILLQKRRAVT
jgi:hypothetical protein